MRTYQISSAKVYICFCGDSYAGSFGITFSRAENKYIDSEEDEKIIELNWTNYDTSSVDAFIKSFREKKDGFFAWAEAGFRCYPAVLCRRKEEKTQQLQT